MAKPVNFFGELLKRTRKAKGMTVQEVAETFPVDERTLYRYEAGKHLCPGTAVRFYEIYNEWQLLTEYCNACPIRKTRIQVMERS